MSHLRYWVTMTHTARYHAHYHTTGAGHLYQGRFKSFPVQCDEHFLVVCRYVERNALAAGLVAAAQDWRFGSLYNWADGRCGVKLTAWPMPRLPGPSESATHFSPLIRKRSEPSGADPLHIFGDLLVAPTDTVASAGIPARLWSFVGEQA